MRRIPAVLSALIAAILCLGVLGASTAVAKGAPKTFTKTVKLNRSGANETYRIELPDTDYRLKSITIIPKKFKRSVDISRKEFRLGGSEYRFRATHVEDINVRVKVVFRKPRARPIAKTTFTKTVKLNRSGASKTYRIELPDTDYRLKSITIIPKKFKRSVDISRKEFRLGGSEYRFRATHVEDINVRVKVVFRKPRTG